MELVSTPTCWTTSALMLHTKSDCNVEARDTLHSIISDTACKLVPNCLMLLSILLRGRRGTEGDRDARSFPLPEHASIQLVYSRVSISSCSSSSFSSSISICDYLPYLDITQRINPLITEHIHNFSDELLVQCRFANCIHVVLDRDTVVRFQDIVDLVDNPAIV